MSAAWPRPDDGTNNGTFRTWPPGPCTAGGSGASAGGGATARWPRRPRGRRRPLPVRGPRPHRRSARVGHGARSRIRTSPHRLARFRAAVPRRRTDDRRTHLVSRASNRIRLIPCSPLGSPLGHSAPARHPGRVRAFVRPPVDGRLRGSSAPPARRAPSAMRCWYHDPKSRSTTAGRTSVPPVKIRNIGGSGRTVQHGYR